MFHFYTASKRQKPNIFWRSEGGGVESFIYRNYMISFTYRNYVLYSLHIF